MTSINNINIHLTVIVSLTVPPLLAYYLSNIDVILLLLVILVLPASVLSNLTTASLILYNFGSLAHFIQFWEVCKIRKLSGSHNFITHSPKIRFKC